MRSYSETTVFPKYACIALKNAERIVRVMPDDLDDDPQGLRCHELARVVELLLNREMASLFKTYGYARVVDGKFAAVEHSWLLLGSPKIILDTYAVGSLPQVQLVDMSLIGPKHRERYKADSERRRDIRFDVVNRGVDFWERFLREEEKLREEQRLYDMCP